MPRRPRHCLPNTPLHVVQRGVNRQDCFRDARDFRSYLSALHEVSADYCVAVHAYVLMTNHVHLLVTPQDEAGASNMMQQLGRKYVSYFNKAHERTGTLWEGRFRSSMITSSRYLFACHRYIELNPVRAGIVSSPEQYRWSSFHANGLGCHDELITQHGEIIALAPTLADRRDAYRRLFIGTHDEADDEIRIAYRKGLSLQ
jgi:putative transposase